MDGGEIATDLLGDENAYVGMVVVNPDAEGGDTMRLKKMGLRVYCRRANEGTTDYKIKGKSKFFLPPGSIAAFYAKLESFEIDFGQVPGGFASLCEIRLTNYRPFNRTAGAGTTVLIRIPER